MGEEDNPSLSHHVLRLPVYSTQPLTTIHTTVFVSTRPRLTRARECSEQSLSCVFLFGFHTGPPRLTIAVFLKKRNFKLVNVDFFDCLARYSVYPNLLLISARSTALWEIPTCVTSLFTLWHGKSVWLLDIAYTHITHLRLKFNIKKSRFVPSLQW